MIHRNRKVFHKWSEKKNQPKSSGYYYAVFVSSSYSIAFFERQNKMWASLSLGQFKTDAFNFDTQKQMKKKAKRTTFHAQMLFTKIAQQQENEQKRFTTIKI